MTAIRVKGRRLKAQELPQRLQDEAERVKAEAYVTWHRERIDSLSPVEFKALIEEREKEIEAELAGGTWGHAIHAALTGDASRLALQLTRGRLPLELADLVYGLLLSAPWCVRADGRPVRLNAGDKAGVCIAFQIEHVMLEKPYPLVVDGLAHRYGVSPSTIKRALREQGLKANRRVTTHRVLSARKRQ
jgi:hypothetical protein